MARLLRATRRAFLSSSLSFKTLITPVRQPFPQIDPLCNSVMQTRNFMADMRKSPFDGTLLRILSNEIQYEFEYAPLAQPVTQFNSFAVEDRPGEQWIRLRSKYGMKEEIKIDVTMFNGLVHDTKSVEDDTVGDVKFRISLIVDISKGNDGNVLEFVCLAWPNCLEVQNVFVLPREVGPDFKDLDDKLQDSMLEFLEARGVNDELAVFLHEYIMNKDRTELIRWLSNVRSFVEK